MTFDDFIFLPILAFVCNFMFGCIVILTFALIKKMVW